MKAVTEVFEVARSHQHDLRSGQTKSRRRYSARAIDSAHLPLIRQLVDERPTYGYRRITALLNLRLVALEQPKVNAKRVYRIMRVNALLLQKHSGKPTRRHDGVIRTHQSNRRWCSDIMEIPCETGERVRIAFSLDCCDREVLSYVATTGGITADMVRDLMLDSVHRRFGDIDKVPPVLQWLSDNGSAYIAEDTREFAALLGLQMCTTPYRSPESNGMAEAFVKTFKRDYISVHGAPDAMSLMSSLSSMFDDYNENAPHKGLRMLSPKQFRRLQNKLEGCPV